MSQISLIDLRKVFVDSHTGREVVAVKNVNLQIESGEFLTLLGPSGCGKTTILRMLAGFEIPTSGDIQINGKSIANEPPNNRNSAMVFQSYALFPHMNVEQNISYGLKLRKMDQSAIQKKLDRFVEIVGLKGYEKRRPNELSGGQQQRVALARALIVEPEVLLFDEPLSNLDAKLRESMRSEIRRIQLELGITSVYVTHDQVEAMAVSDRIVVMNKGEAEQVGKPLDIYLRPKTLFVADFMGAANFVDGMLESSEDSSSTLDVQGESIKVPYADKSISSKSRIKVIVRPESIDLSTPDAPEGLPATIESHHYLGADHEYLLTLENGQKLIARSEVEAGGVIYKPSDKVKVQFEAKNLHYVAA